jgi:hypothetical protein
MQDLNVGRRSRRSGACSRRSYDAFVLLRPRSPTGSPAQCGLVVGLLLDAARSREQTRRRECPVASAAHYGWACGGASARH